MYFPLLSHLLRGHVYLRPKHTQQDSKPHRKALEIALEEFLEPLFAIKYKHQLLSSVNCEIPPEQDMQENCKFR